MDQQPQENQSKVAKNFQKSLEKLTLVLGGKTLFAPIKLKSKEVQAAIEELAREEKEAKVELFKKKAKELIQSKRDFDSFVNKQKKELDKKIEAEQEKFTKDAEECFRMLEDIENIEQSYLNTLEAAEKGETLPDEKKEE